MNFILDLYLNLVKAIQINVLINKYTLSKALTYQKDESYANQQFNIKLLLINSVRFVNYRLLFTFKSVNIEYSGFD